MLAASFFMEGLSLCQGKNIKTPDNILEVVFKPHQRFKRSAFHDVSTTIILAIPLKKAKEQLIDSNKIVPCLSGLQKFTKT